nr:phospho-N-acetylmuramoyl-pentapeptide-transferase [Prochlorococcus sp. MIT 1307]
MKIKKDKTDGKVSSALLTSLIFAASFSTDYYLSTNLLSLPLFLSTLISLIICHYGIPKLRALKLKQIIREEGPQKHYKKSGTPTMGGILIIPIALIIGNSIPINGSNKQQLLAISFLTLAFMLIGALDDWRSLTMNRNAGLKAKEKLALQAITGILFLNWASWQEWINTKIYLFSDISLDIGIWVWPLALFVLLAESNATNLTDGLDGLASGCSALVFTGLAIQLILRDNPNNPIIICFCMAMAGAWLGFLFHNRNPAKVFMGDTGSLAIGAALSGVALLSNSLWALLIMGGVFLIESLSVIIQVWVFKLTKQIAGKGNRVFKMAPLHHHYELAGNNERLIVRNFWLVTLGLVLIGLLLRPTP